MSQDTNHHELRGCLASLPLLWASRQPTANGQAILQDLTARVMVCGFTTQHDGRSQLLPSSMPVESLSTLQQGSALRSAIAAGQCGLHAHLHVDSLGVKPACIRKIHNESEWSRDTMRSSCLGSMKLLAQVVVEQGSVCWRACKCAFSRDRSPAWFVSSLPLHFLSISKQPRGSWTYHQVVRELLANQ